MKQVSKQKVDPGPLEKAYATQLARGQSGSVIAEIMKRNPAVFRKKEKSHEKIILSRLGWIDVVRQMQPEVRRMEDLVRQVKESGTEHLFILGMGGSSLAPDVFGAMFGHQGWLKSYTVVDTTSPTQLDAIVKATDFSKAFFIVSSKSGTTLETQAQFRFFFRTMKDLRPLKAGNYFAAVSDEKSELHRIARRNRFTEIFLNPADIGGRYSALSYFGLVPAAFTKADLRAILAQTDEFLTTLETHGGDNDALTLGTLMGCGAKGGYDKLRFAASGKMAPLIPWIEQLIAESTGKDMKGIIPVEGAPDGAGVLTDDLMVVNYWMRREKPVLATAVKGPSKQRLPKVDIEVADASAIGVEMLKWEMATAVAASILGVNPFDEPNVAESKKNAASVLQGKRGPRKIIPIVPIATYETVDVVSAEGIRGLERNRQASAAGIFDGFLKGVRPGDFLGILCFTEMSPKIEQALSKLREAIEVKYGITTLRGYGPRYLHSTGQLFKGGSQKGHFLVIQREVEDELEIPNMTISFGRLIKAQAKGDIKALRKRKRPVVDVNVGLVPLKGIGSMTKLIQEL